MKLKLKNFNWLAGRPVAIINEKCAKKLNIHVDDRISILNLENNKTISAVVDIFSKLAKDNEIVLSKEIISVLKTRKNSVLEVSVSEEGVASRLINKKLSGKTLSEEEIKLLVKEIVSNNLTEAEIAFFVAAEKIKGMSIKEIIYLTRAMVESGNKINFNKKIVADKHCIGGIAGNRTTPIVVSICAAAGLTIPKTSSRAITSAAGTADVIETLSKVEFSPKEIKEIVKKTNACLTWGGGLNLAPSDDKIIRVERLLNLDVKPQLLASIMSKKIAAGSNHILIDIPYGDGSKIESMQKAKELGETFKTLAKHFRVKVKTVYTNGNQPIGNGIGPVLEMLDILKVLKCEFNAPKDLREKSLFLAAELMSLCKIKKAKQLAIEILDSGKAYEKFQEIINYQNSFEDKKVDFQEKIKELIPAKFKKTIYMKKNAKIFEIDNKKINSVCHVLGTPETKSAGVYLHKHLGKAEKKEPLITLYSESKERLRNGLKFFKEFNPFLIK